MPDGKSLQEADREALAAWMRDRIETMQRQSEERIEKLRTVGEHPSPIFSGMVRNFGALGIEISLVARLMNVSVTIMKSHYLADYELGKAEIISSVAANMLRIGTSVMHQDAAKVGMDILNRRGGEEWRPPAQKLEVKKTDDGPPIIDSSKLTYEERRQLRQMLVRIENGGEGEPLTPDENQPLIE
jgi:hypothetical protein